MSALPVRRRRSICASRICLWRSYQSLFSASIYSSVGGVGSVSWASRFRGVIRGCCWLLWSPDVGWDGVASVISSTAPDGVNTRGGEVIFMILALKVYWVGAVVVRPRMAPMKKHECKDS